MLDEIRLRGSLSVAILVIRIVQKRNKPEKSKLAYDFIIRILKINYRKSNFADFDVFASSRPHLPMVGSVGRKEQRITALKEMNCALQSIHRIQSGTSLGSSNERKRFAVNI